MVLASLGKFSEPTNSVALCETKALGLEVAYDIEVKHL